MPHAFPHYWKEIGKWAPLLSSPHFEGKEKKGFKGILLLSLDVRER